jgi:hypothetical protein
MAEMKAEGIEFDERIAELEKMEYPKPNREFIYDTFNAFSATHPWVGNENIRPKSIAREMYETFQSFDEYIRDYEQQRAEGLLLRYLMEVYKVLVQTVPEAYRNEEIEAMIDYFGQMIRNIDSSLWEEWEKIRNPGRILAKEDAPAREEAFDITRDSRAFTVLIRNEVFRFVRALAAGDYEAAAAMLEPGSADSEVNWNATLLKSTMASFYEERRDILTDRNARHPQHCRISPNSGSQDLRVEQTLLDAMEYNDWQAAFVVSKSRSRVEGRAVVQLLSLGEIYHD